MKTMAIHVLSKDLAAKIAAGEVIERPASVVKELIENSIDAGARDIRIEIRTGGQRLIRVADDGCGIPAAQVETAFARHATSKIESIDDLFRIQTLGFRGEGLPSIAAVARVTLVTHARGEESGTLIRLENSQVLEQLPQGGPAGTVVTVEDLFRHVPARLKFLKTPATEAGRIADLVNAYALAFPQLHLSLVGDDRPVFQSPGSGKMFDALVKVLGVETAKEMLEVGNRKSEIGSEKLEIGNRMEEEDLDPSGRGESGHRTSTLHPPTSDLQLPTSGIQVQGYVSPPSISRATRKNLIFFVNHRWIQDRTLSYAVTEAYHTSLMVGRFPIAVLDILMPPDAVDVNVHPTKSEVRFRDTNAVFNAVQRAVRGVVAAHAPIPSVYLGPVPGPAAPFSVSPDQSRLAVNLYRPGPSGPPPVESGAVKSSAQNGAQDTRLPMLRVLGQIASTYIIAEGPEGLYLIDQHSAHERVLYEQLREERAQASIPIQELLDPIPIPLMPSQVAILEANLGALALVGFRLEPFGNQTALLRAVPAILKTSDPKGTVLEILEELEQGEEPLEKSADARLISSVCKSLAVKGGQVLSLEEMRELVRRLEQTSAPRTCPHGRPTVVYLNVAMLAREFGRK